MKVKKRDGREEDFSKMKIVAALVKAGASVSLAEEIASECESRFMGRESVESSEIKEFVLSVLRERERSAYDNWLRFDSMAKGLSKGD